MASDAARETGKVYKDFWKTCGPITMAVAVFTVIVVYRKRLDEVKQARKGFRNMATEVGRMLFKQKVRAVRLLY